MAKKKAENAPVTGPTMAAAGAIEPPPVFDPGLCGPRVYRAIEGDGTGYPTGTPLSAIVGVTYAEGDGYAANLHVFGQTAGLTFIKGAMFDDVSFLPGTFA